MSRDQPALSVVMPVYNARETVAQAVQSVLESTFSDLELVVTDDGSTDDSLAILLRLAARDARIQCVSQNHQGVARTMNGAVARSRSAWIARMDADDVCLPHRLQEQWDLVIEKGWDGVGGLVEVVDEQGCPVSTWQRYQSWVNENLDPDSLAAFRFVESPLVNPTVLARREVWELQCRDGPWPEDYDLWLRALQHGYRFGKVPRPVLRWMDHSSRLTRTDDRYSPEAFDRCRRMHLRAGPLHDVSVVDLWGAGQTGKPWLHWLQGEGIEVRRIMEVSPRKVGLHLHGVPMVDPAELGDADGTPLVIAVGAEGARQMILDHIRPRGYEAGRDAWFVA